MTTTTTPPRPDPSRSGAVWVTGMGAFLLLAAAAVFTAVRWEQIPDAAKLGALVAATGSCLVAGRGLRNGLPATAGALLHLGAFLVPIDVAAIGVRADLDWSTLLLAQGLVAAVTFGWAAQSERSVVLRWAFGASVVVLAGGIGATTAVPAPLVLAAFAAGALTLRRHDAAIGWAALAGAAPLLTFLDSFERAGSGTIEQLGLTGDDPRALALLTGGVAAVVLAIAGRRRDDVGLALLGTLAASTGVVASWSGMSPEPGHSVVGLAVVFLLVQVTAHATRHDPFWVRPAGIVARVAEVPGQAATALILLAIAATPSFGSTDGRLALATAVLGLGWLASDLRTGTGRASSTIGAATALVGTVALATGSPAAVSASMLAVAALALLAPLTRSGPGTSHQSPTIPGQNAAFDRVRPGAHLVAGAAAITAPLMALDSSGLAAAAAGVFGCVLLTEAAVRQSRSSAPGAAGRADEATAWVLAIVAMVPGTIAVASFAGDTGEVAVALIAGAALATLVAAQADRGRTAAAGLPLGTVARLQGVSVLAGVADLAPEEVGLVALVVALLSGIDAVRLDRPEIALGASMALPIAVGSLTHAAGLGLPATGVALTVSAVVMAGLGSQLGRRWAMPVLTGIGLALGAGLTFAAADATALADAVIVTGGLGLAAAIAAGRLDGVYLAGAAITAGTWLRLADGGVGASEPYLVPVCALLLVAGLRARSIGTSSWIAYGPVVGLLGGSALLERMGGGAGWHAVLAGAVGTAAVAAGGSRRLAAPLLLGSGLLVALVGFETLAVTSSLPTWVWLGAGGSTLLAAGVAMERHEVGPLETGRRLVEVVSDGYA